MPSGKGAIRTKVHLAKPEDGEGEPGTVLDDALLIACGTDAVRLTRLQREGRAAMDAKEFLRGNTLSPGTVLD